jgi:hypothetical protein
MIAEDEDVATLWVGLPIADPMVVLQRHLSRATRRHPPPERVSVFRAAVYEPIDRGLSRDVGSLIHSVIGRDDLAVELDRSHWLLAVVRTAGRAEKLRRRIERRRDAVNRKRLGQPLPAVRLQSIGSWPLPNALGRILATVRRRIAEHEPAGACAE